MRCELNAGKCGNDAEVTVHAYADAPAGTGKKPRRLPMTDRPPKACSPCAETFRGLTLRAWKDENPTVEILPLACDTYQGECER
jgi:hypothetical protein